MKLHSPSEVTWSPGASFWVSWLPLLQVHAVQNCCSYLISLRKFSLGVGLTLQRQRKEIKRNLVLDITGLWQKKKTNPKPRTTNNLCGVHLILANWARHSPLLPETIWNRFPGPSNIKACWYPVHVQGPMSQAPQNPEGGQTRLLPQIKQNTRKKGALQRMQRSQPSLPLNLCLPFSGFQNVEQERKTTLKLTSSNLSLSRPKCLKRQHVIVDRSRLNI